MQEFPHTGDVCHLAHCYPYPYSRLLHVLDTLQSCPQRRRHVKRESLCKTLAGNDCPLITVTDFESKIVLSMPSSQTSSCLLRLRGGGAERGGCRECSCSPRGDKQQLDDGRSTEHAHCRHPTCQGVGDHFRSTCFRAYIFSIA